MFLFNMCLHSSFPSYIFDPRFLQKKKRSIIFYIIPCIVWLSTCYFIHTLYYHTITNISVYEKIARTIFTAIFIPIELVFTSMHEYLDLKVLKNTGVNGLTLHNLPNNIFGANSKKTLEIC